MSHNLKQIKMKKFLLVLVVLLYSVTVFSQIDAKSKTVLNDFILGYDSEQSLIKKGIEINESNRTLFNDDKVKTVRLNEYFYGKDVVLVFVDNTLYSVRYYVYNNNQYERYIKKLNLKYTINETNVEWCNKYLLIKYDMGEDDVPESFIHYDVSLLIKYPQCVDL